MTVKTTTREETATLIEGLEQQLDSFDAGQRKQALLSLLDMVKAGKIGLPEPGRFVNLHCHTFFSYNTYGYSPTKFAWLARKAGLAVVGTTDFDVLDALDEFRAACRRLGLKGCSGLETRVYVPEFSTRVINSPGEPGISYHMGVGFPSSKVPASQQDFLRGLKQTAQQRNRDLMQRVNRYLRPIELDYERDVLTLTPAGNATERHMCLAYARKARDHFGQMDKLVEFWSQKLGADAQKLGLPEGRDLLNTIRARTMKRGGVGYVPPDSGSFPLMADTNRFILAAGGMPVHTWLDGASDGEQAIEELLDVALSTGAVALNVIPDRNYTPGAQDQKIKNLYRVVEVAQRRHLVVVEGTEMNSPGQKFVDDFDTEELAPLLPVFLKSAHIVYAHSVLQRQCGLGYTSAWANKHLGTAERKNAFFEEAGATLKPQQEENLGGLKDSVLPKDILKTLPA
ncbi:MAG: hypothetical protein A2Y77_12135 [Planctomycetes bacterium RBG_13_62_9]|nr:MAG: hypothetical protein A2Y77_12135 [Planctomycetes bacterium RBG_13_62_9]